MSSLFRWTIAATALALSLAALAAVLFAGSGHAGHRKYTIAFVTNETKVRNQGRARGERLAAKKLGVRFLVVGPCCSGQPGDTIPAVRSLIARHVDAIVAEGYDPLMRPIFAQVRGAAIRLIASGDDIAGKRDLWVSQSSNLAYPEALADALASQMHGRGEYAILEERDEYPVADVWGKVVQNYVRKAYPKMKLDTVIRGTGAGDQNELDSVKSFISRHPKLRGLIGVTPTEGWAAAEAITKTHKIGKVFCADNGDDDFSAPTLAFARSGAAELVYVSNPFKLGYLTVWAANYLVTGHRFKPGAYQVGGPIGLVWYYAKHRELRLGQPLTITKTNVDLYAGKF